MKRSKTKDVAVGELMPRIDDAQQSSLSELRRRAALVNPDFVAHVGAGRKPGTKNRVTKRVRDSVLDVYEKMGGDAAFLRWARNNQDQFYKFFMRMMPQEDKVRPNQLAILLLRGDDKL